MDQEHVGDSIQITNLDLSRTNQDAINEKLSFVSQFDQLQLFGAYEGGYVGPSSRAVGMVYNTFNSGQMPPLPSPCNGNCTFNQTFFGPAYKCDEVTSSNDVPGDPICYNIAA